MKNIIYAVIAVTICFVCCKSCVSDYIKGGDKTAIARYEKMLADSSVITATLQDQYTEVTVKIMKVPVKTYKFKYDYVVDGHKYTGEHMYTTLPDDPEQDIYYLTSDPSFSSFDPKKELAAEKEKNSAKGPLYWGIGWGIFGVLIIFGFISELKEKRTAKVAAIA